MKKTKTLTNISRRNFIQSASSAALALPLACRLARSAPLPEGLIRPKALRSGDVVGVITPSTPVTDPDRLAVVSHTLSYFGLRAKLGKNVGKRSATYEASVEERLDDLHSMFRDKEVSAVFALRGGYGCGHLLDRIDYDLIRRNPKIFLGFSDITALHLAIHKRARLVTFHGPVVTSSFTDYTQQSFHKALFETQPAGKLTNPHEGNELRPRHTLRTIRPGTATGPLIGGNLSLIASTMGTPYEIETRGRILFVEDIGEEPYRVDRMLTQLRLAGKFDGAAGVIFGECDGCAPNDFKPSFASPYSFGEVLDNILGQLKVPVLSGLTIGHTADQLTLPLGVAATLDADAGTLEIKEAAVV
ncbi:MAG TPA: LD-carboxypeptidase [Pyrinomonadaceae bacterium]|nr:LD-carboxypeptidase [Pyrinomonadaceae bacterium]